MAGEVDARRGGFWRQEGNARKLGDFVVDGVECNGGDLDKVLA